VSRLAEELYIPASYADYQISARDFDAFAEVKRFQERWVTDPEFRAQLPQAPQATVDRYQIAVDPMPLQFVWQNPKRPHFEVPAAADHQNPWVRAYKLYLRWQQAYGVYAMAKEALLGADPRYVAWREREMARCQLAMGPQRAAMGLYLPFAVELTVGCSVGCWFCGLSAESLTGSWPATARHRAHWRQLLEVMKDFFGDYAQRGFLYWATDPMDHPRYEDFAEDFAQVLGAWPAFTSAIPMRDLERTRRLIEKSRRGHCSRQRFSILTVRGLDELHAAFTARELADVDVVPVNKGSLLGLAIAGRVLTKQGRMTRRLDEERNKVREILLHQPQGADKDDLGGHESITCVAGFLLNLPERRLQLIAAVPACAEHPDGLVVLSESRWQEPEDFAVKLGRMVDWHMPAELPWDRPLALLSGLRLERDAGESLLLSAKGRQLRYRSRHCSAEQLEKLLRLFETGTDGIAPEQVLARLSRSVKRAYLEQVIRALWNGGVLVAPSYNPARTKPLKWVRADEALQA